MNTKEHSGKSLLRENGQAIVLIVLVMTALLGITAVAVDGGRMYYGRRTAQSAADNAALAGALAICDSSDPVAASFASAATNGFDNNGDTNTVEVNFPPSSGPNAGDDEFVEVIIATTQEASFAKVVTNNDLHVSSRAVARCFSTFGPVAGGYAVIVLNDSDDCAFNVTGSGSAAAVQGGIYINSNGSTALCASGGGQGPGGVPRIDAERIDVVGGYDIPEWIDVNPNPPQSGSPSLTDPLADLDPPIQPADAIHPWTCSGFPGSLTSGKTNPYPTPGGDLNQGNHWWTTEITICPGTYNSIYITSDAHVVMMPGVYYIKGKVPGTNFGFLVDGNTQVTGSGVMIYLETGGVHIGASGLVDLTPPSTGAWTGMMFYMDRNNSSEFLIDGDGDIVIKGTTYAPSGYIHVTGSGTTTTFDGQFIGETYLIEGAGLIRMDYDQDHVFGGSSGSAYIDLAE